MNFAMIAREREHAHLIANAGKLTGKPAGRLLVVEFSNFC